MKKSARKKTSVSRSGAITAEQRRAAALGDPDDELIIHLNPEESRRFVKAIARKPRKPNKHQLAGLRNYRRLIQQDQSS